jgi:hypothetical protein
MTPDRALNRTVHQRRRACWLRKNLPAAWSSDDLVARLDVGFPQRIYISLKLAACTIIRFSAARFTAPVNAGVKPRRGEHMLRALVLASLFGLLGCAFQPLPDLEAPEERQSRLPARSYPATYAEALQSWNSPEHVNAWIADMFEYDRARAIRMSETQRQENGSLPIHEPAQFYVRAEGVCVDLARFAVETLQAVAPETKSRYVMLEFAPVVVQGNTLRRHWLASFERDGKLYFFGDSKRPGHIAGPYSSTDDFVAEYARYRGREVISFRELPSYRKKLKTKLIKRDRATDAALAR